MIGEATTLITIDFFLIYRMVSVETNFELGYATIGVIAVYILICAFFIIKNTVLEGKSNVKRWLVLCMYRRKRKKL